MNLKEFKSGKYIQQFEYKSFSPIKVNREWTWDNPIINVLLEQATRALGELNTYTLIVPDIDLFIRMHIIKEATLSSRIEGTRTEIDDAIMDISNILPEKRDDWQEVQNYVEAINVAIEKLKELPLSNRLLRETHKILLSGVRGEHKNPGEFRRSQNWIGGTGLKDAFFIPPSHEEIPDLIGDLEKFWHNEAINVPDLIRIAISHYQFETIHPFLDGNGRIGRLLITLYLVSKGLLKKPSLYLSAYLAKHQGAYYDALTTARSSNDLAHWIKFFLQSVYETAQNGVETFNHILKLKTEMDEKILSFGRRAVNAGRLINYLYSHPEINLKTTIDLLNVSKPAANNLIDDFVTKEILVETTGYGRNRIFIFDQYVKIFYENLSDDSG